MREDAKLLIDEYPLVILPSLAVAIGLNEAIVLQQIHYWINSYRKVGDFEHFKNDRWWVYNSIPAWQENFPFFSESTIKRALNNLRDAEIVIVDNFNKAGFDKTKWYTIDYEKLQEIADHQVKMTRPSVQNDPIQEVNLTRPIPETTIDYSKDISGGGSENQSSENSEIGKVFKTYESEIGMLTPFVRENMLDAMEHYPRDWIIEAIKEAAAQNARNWSYAESILKRWKSQGFKSDSRKQKSKTVFANPERRSMLSPEAQKLLEEDIAERKRLYGDKDDE